MGRYEDTPFQLRLHTFKDFPATGKTAESLAAAGFKYKGYNDIVRCCQCGLELKNWEYSDPLPFDVHMQKSPDCLFFMPPQSDIAQVENVHSTDREIKQFVRSALSYRPITEIILTHSEFAQSQGINLHPAESTPRFRPCEVRAALREFARRRGVLNLPSAVQIVKLIYSREMA